MHGVENQDSHAKMGVNGQCVQPLCWSMYAFVGVLSMVYAFMVFCCRGFVEAYRDLLELECKVPLGSQVWRDIYGYGKIPCINQATGIPGQFLGTCLFVASHCCDSDQG